MDPLLILAIIVGLPVLLLTLLHVNAATAFLALSLGSLLGKYVSQDINDLLRGYIAPNSQFAESFISVTLLWLPVVLVSLFMIRTISKKQRFINLLPAVSVGLVGALLTVPFLVPDAQAVVFASEWWGYLEEFQAVIVLVGTVISLVLLRMRKPFNEKHK